MTIWQNKIKIYVCVWVSMKVFIAYLIPDIWRDHQNNSSCRLLRIIAL